MKKIIALLLALVMVLSLAGCKNDGGSSNSGSSTSSSSGSSDSSSSNSGSTSSTSSSSSTSSDEKINITMWCIATETDSNRKAYEKAIDELKKNHPEINFQWEAFENESYKTKIKAAISANEQPDIFFTWSCAFLNDFVKTGKVYCLDDTLKQYSSELTDNMLGNTTFDGKHYGVPTTMNIVGLFANMDLLAEVGYTEIPGTYDEFIACCDALKAKGIIPFGCSGGETWCVTEYLESVIEKSIGADALNDIFLGRATWDNQGVADAVDTFQKLVNNGYFDPDGLAVKNDDIKANFMAGEYAFYMNGTWNCADFAADPNFFPKVKVAEFPVINSGSAKLGQLIGGPSDTLAVSATSPNAAKAAEIAAELGKLICHYGYLDGCGLPAWIPYGDTSTVNGLTQTVADICAKADTYVLFGDTAMSAEDKDIYLEYVAKVYTGQIDGAGFIKGLKESIR